MGRREVFRGHRARLYRPITDNSPQLRIVLDMVSHNRHMCHRPVLDALPKLITLATSPVRTPVPHFQVELGRQTLVVRNEYHSLTERPRRSRLQLTQ